MLGQFFSLSRYNLSQWKLGRLLPGPPQLISPCRPCPLVQVHSSLWQHLAFSVCSREHNNRLRALSPGPHNLSRLDNCPRAIFYWNPVESALHKEEYSPKQNTMLAAGWLKVDLYFQTSRCHYHLFHLSELSGENWPINWHDFPWPL